MRQVNLFDIVMTQDLSKIEDTNELLRTIKASDCTRCRRAEYRNSNNGQQITIFRGNPDAKLWVIGKSPGVNDGLEGVPYSFGSGDLLRKWIDYIGLDHEKDAFMTNPVFCSAEDDATPTQAEIKACSFYFNMLIDRLKPKVFLCLGMTAFQSVTEGQYRDARLSELAGSPTSYPTRLGIPAWLVYHPAFFFKGTPEVEQAKEKTKITLDSLKAAIKSY